MASADKQAARNREILIAKAKGDDTNEIAERHDLSPTRVRQILAAGTVVLADMDVDPVQVALEHRAEYASIVEKAAALFDTIPDSNPSPKVGALRLYLAALNHLCAWDQNIGVVPADLAWVSKEVNARKSIQALWQGVEAAGIPREAINEAIQVMQAAESE